MSSATALLRALKVTVSLPHGCGRRVSVDPAAQAVDDVSDLAAGVAVEPHRGDVVKFDAPGSWGLDGAVGAYGRVAEVSIDAHPPGFVAGHRVGNLVRSVTLRRTAHPGRLVRHVVRHLGLVEIDAA